MIKLDMITIFRIVITLALTSIFVGFVFFKQDFESTVVSMLFSISLLLVVKRPRTHELINLLTAMTITVKGEMDDDI
jgi:hypothetical protein